MNGSLLQLHSTAALNSADGMSTYAADMHKIVAILSAPEPAFSWWTAVFLVLIFLIWCAALTTAWLLLNRSVGRRSTAAQFHAAPLRNSR
jgi:hypothetical protein